MNRLDRITSILVQLQSKRLITAREMATRFEVSLRTIYRDIHSLRNAGVPIGEEEGKGYFLVDGYRLPPVMFSREEAAALATAEKMLAFQGETSLKTHFQTAMLKIKAILGPEEKAMLEDLDARIGTYRSWAPSTKLLDVIQRCISERMAMEITYHSRYKRQITERIVHPYALYFSGVAWSVIGYCTLREAIREFRIDRIGTLETTSERFEADPKFQLDDYLAQRREKNFNTPDNGLSAADV